MRDWFRIHRGNWLTGSIHVVIVAIAAHSESAAAWRYSLIAISIVSFAAWIGNYRRLRHIADTPTSNVASAAQGYVELHGQGEALHGAPVISKLTGIQCLWFRYEIYEKSSDDKWSLEESGESDDPFVIRDSTGICVVDPEGAEIVCSRKKSWKKDQYRYTEWTLLAQDRIYALGEFATIGGANSDLDLDADVGALLADWKRSQPELHQRFDLDRDGMINLREWELARRQARREVEAHHRELRASIGTHVIRRPQDGRLFLISNCLPEKLCRQYHIWSWVHVAVFVGAIGGALALA